MNKILGVIPARYESSRLPGKPLVDIGGETMISRVFRQASKCDSLNEVIVATDDDRIYREIDQMGGNVIMTSSEHRNGTERCCEVVEKLSKGFDYVINIQGDEPFIAPESINGLASVLNGKSELGTLVKKIIDYDDLWKDSVMKVVFDNRWQALYFSRQCIPYVRSADKDRWLEQATFYKHVAIYAYRVDILKEIVRLPMGRLEGIESLEQLRWMENGFQIQIVETEYESMSIDTPADLEKIRSLYGYSIPK